MSTNEMTSMNKTLNITKTILRSDELSCPSCISNIESALNRKEGVEKARVHFASGKIEIEHVPERISQKDLVEEVRKAGYEAKVSAF